MTHDQAGKQDTQTNAADAPFHSTDGAKGATSAREDSAHWAAMVFPIMDDEALGKLAEDIRENGLREPIVLLDGQVLDGRNRLSACKLAGVEPVFSSIAEVDDPLSYVIGVNLHRRHLTPGQRAMAAARAKEALSGLARDRQRGGRGGKSLPAGLPEAKGDARDQAGELFSVGGRTVDAATKVLANGCAELQTAVDRGHISLNKAAALATLPEADQLQGLQEYGGSRRRRRQRPQAPPVSELLAACAATLKKAIKRIRDSDGKIDDPECDRCFQHLEGIENAIATIIDALVDATPPD